MSHTYDATMRPRLPPESNTPLIGCATSFILYSIMQGHFIHLLDIIRVALNTILSPLQALPKNDRLRRSRMQYQWLKAYTPSFIQSLAWPTASKPQHSNLLVPDREYQATRGMNGKRHVEERRSVSEKFPKYPRNTRFPKKKNA